MPRRKEKSAEPVQVTLDSVVGDAGPTPRKRSKKSTRAASAPTVSDIPGVGKKMAERLVAAGYKTVRKVAKARPATLAKKVEGLSEKRAERIVAAAKELLAVPRTGRTTAPPPTTPAAPAAPEEPAAAPSAGGAPPAGPTLELTDVPGVGPRLAVRLRDAGYDSVARLARSRPSTVAQKVSGLSEARAATLVTAARDLIREVEVARVTGAPVAAPRKRTRRTTAARETRPPTATDRGRTTRTTTTTTAAPARRKRSRKKKSEAEKETVSTPRRTPGRLQKTEIAKIRRKKSGLPVPDAIVRLAKEMKRQWREAEKAAGAAREVQLETVEVVDLTRQETMERLVEVAMEVLNEAMTTGRPAFEIPSRSSDNIVWDEVRDLLLLGMRKITRPYHSLGSVVDATRTARIMEIVYQLLKSNLHATKREVFYSDVNLFREQKHSDKIIEDVASMLRTTRDSIHIVASARGSAMGRVIIRDGGDLIDLTRMGTGGWAITPFLDQVEIVESDAEFILLSEKDAAVMRLAEAKYWNRQPCIVLTGKGSGDIATRAFLKMLVKELEIPAFALVDSDPYGHYIYSVFLRGSKRLSYESPFIATPELKLLGVLSRDLDAYNIPKAVRIPMEPADIKRVKDMLKEPFVQKNKPWVEDLRLMLKLKEKAEIQAFASHSFEFLTDEYIPRKLETGDWI